MLSRELNECVSLPTSTSPSCIRIDRLSRSRFLKNPKGEGIISNCNRQEGSAEKRIMDSFNHTLCIDKVSLA
jgi:hypothetical protein